MYLGNSAKVITVKPLLCKNGATIISIIIIVNLVTIKNHDSIHEECIHKLWEVSVPSWSFSLLKFKEKSLSYNEQILWGFIPNLVGKSSCSFENRITSCDTSNIIIIRI